MAVTVVLACHVAAALTCVLTGPLAMLSKKRRGWHTRFGAIYDGSFSLAVVSLTGLSVLRWATDGDLVLIGTVAFGCASLGYAARKIRWHGWITAPITGMSVSYIALLTGFYVDNGCLLPPVEGPAAARLLAAAERDRPAACAARCRPAPRVGWDTRCDHCARGSHGVTTRLAVCRRLVVALVA